MGQILHGSARTTAAVRRAIPRSQESLNTLAQRGISHQASAVVPIHPHVVNFQVPDNRDRTSPRSGAHNIRSHKSCEYARIMVTAYLKKSGYSVTQID